MARRTGRSREHQEQRDAAGTDITLLEGYAPCCAYRHTGRERLAELWSILDFLNPGLLGSQRSFRERFATPIERYGDDTRAAALRRITAPFILRRVKTDRAIIQDLPDKIEIKEYCNLTREQATLYQAVVDDMLAKVASNDGMERRGFVLATMLRLKLGELREHECVLTRRNG